MRHPTVKDATGIAQFYRSAQVHETAETILDGHNALITTANGMGRSTFLETLAQTLRSRGQQARRISCLEHTAETSITQTALESALLIDDLEVADLSLLRTIRERRLRGGITVSMLNTSSQVTPYARNVVALNSEPHPHTDKSRPMAHVRLEALSRLDTLRLIHETSPTPVDAVLASAIWDLSEGRPEWAVDLLRLAHERNITADPVLRPVQIAGEHVSLPSVQSVLRTVGDIDEATAATAITLAEISALDLQSIQSLVGEATTASLVRHGLLIETRKPHQLTVSKLAAATLLPNVDDAVLHQTRARIAQSLMNFELVSIPLSERDQLFCALRLPSERLREGGSRLFHRVVRSLADFGDSDTLRAVMLRGASIHAEIDCGTRARVLTVFGNSREASQLFAAVDPRAATPQSFEAAYFRSLFADQAEFPRPRLEEPFDGQDLTDHEYVFHLWNAGDSVKHHADRLRDIGASHDSTELSFMAFALLDLEAVWKVRKPDARSWLSRGDSMPVFHSPAPDPLHTLRQTTLVAHALIILISGELTVRAEELFAQVEQFPSAARERMWVMSLVASSEALMSGDLGRAAMEWQSMRKRLPRFLPYRLTSYITAIGEVLDMVASPTFDARTTATPMHCGKPVATYRLVLYLAGNFDVLMHPETGASSHDDSLPIVKTAHTHLEAIASKNPTELMRVASKFFALKMWIPSARAYLEAKQIYIRRRSSVNVQRCDERLSEIQRSLHESLPWHNPATVNVQSPAVLTTRERDVTKFIAKGLSNQDIATALGCTVRTVESHVASARAKYGASDRRDLARKYLAQITLREAELQDRIRA